MTELVLLLVFLLLALLTTITSENAGLGDLREELAYSSRRLAALREELADSSSRLAALREELADSSRTLAAYRADVDSVHGLLNTSLTELRKMASELLPQLAIEEWELGLLEYLNDLLRENRELRAEKARLNSLAAGEGGTEPGSCWLDADGNRVYFLTVCMYNQHLNIKHEELPDNYWRDLESMGINPSDVPSGEVTADEFRRFAQPIYNKTFERGCRLFTHIIDSTTTKEAYTRQLDLVEGYFYKKKTKR